MYEAGSSKLIPAKVATALTYEPNEIDEQSESICIDRTYELALGLLGDGPDGASRRHFGGGDERDCARMKFLFGSHESRVSHC